MFNEFRLTILREMMSTGLDNETLSNIMHIIDRVGNEYDISKKCTSLVPIELTSQHVLLEYLACKSLEGFSKETLKNYHTSLSNFLIAIKKSIEEITTNEIRSYLYQYQNIHNISNRTLNHLRSTISGLFHWAYAEGKIEQDPSLAIHPIKYTVKPKPSLSQLNMEYIRKKTW